MQVFHHPSLLLLILLSPAGVTAQSIPWSTTDPAGDLASWSEEFHQYALDEFNPGLSEGLVQLAWEAFKVSFLVTRSEVGQIGEIEDRYKVAYEIFDGFSDMNDQALVAKYNDVCFAAFMGTQLANPTDQLQNLNLFGPQVVSDSDCRVRGGFHDAYFTSYYKEYRAAVDSCVASCQGGCPMVVTGHSQGGSLAVVASIDLKEYEPYAFTFGALPVIMNRTIGCNGVVPENHYRFVNTVNGVYDKYPMSLPLGAEHVGHMILLDDTNYPIAYPGMVGLANEIRKPTNAQSHNRRIYLTKIQALVEAVSFPIPMTGWEVGHVCHYNDECSGDLYCVNGECSAELQKGWNCEVCEENSDCASGVCRTQSMNRICALTEDGLMAQGCYCNLGMDCITGNCKTQYFNIPMVRRCEAEEIDDDDDGMGDDDGEGNGDDGVEDDDEDGGGIFGGIFGGIGGIFGGN